MEEKGFLDNIDEIAYKYGRPVEPNKLEKILIDNYKNRHYGLLPPMIWGLTGTGKTSIVKKVAKELGIEVIPFYLPTKEIADITGVPMIEKKDGNIPLTKYALPEYFPTEGKGILFFDEINRAQIPTLNAVFNLILEGKLEGYQLPDGYMIVAAGNIFEEDYSLTLIPDALINRFRHFFLLPSARDWVNWAIKERLNPCVISFGQLYFNLLYRKGNSNKISTLRSLEQLSKSLTRFNDPLSAHEVLDTKLANQFVVFYNNFKTIPDIQSILEDNKIKDIKAIAKEDDKKHALITSLIAYAKNVINNKEENNKTQKYLIKILDLIPTIDKGDIELYALRLFFDQFPIYKDYANKNDENSEVFDKLTKLLNTEKYQEILETLKDGKF